MIDFLVIGGGIAGVSAAAGLSAHGSTALLEAEPTLGYHASGRSAAMFEEEYGNATVCALNRASAAHHKAAGVLSPRGLMILARAEEEDSFRADCSAYRMEAISPTEACHRVPILDPKAVRFAARHDDAMDLDTDRLLQGYLKTATANGAQIHLKSPVTAIRRLGKGWEVICGQTSHQARRLINAAGAWSDQIAALAGVDTLGLQAYRRSMARTAAPDGQDVTGWPMIFGTGETWYAKPDAGAWLISPADEDPMPPQDAWAEDMVLAEGIARYEEFVTTPVTRMIANWAGLRTFAPDRTLVIGPEPSVPDFFWHAGQGGYGFQTAPAAADLLTALATGSTPILDPTDIAALSPQRFR